MKNGGMRTSIVIGIIVSCVGAGLPVSAGSISAATPCQIPPAGKTLNESNNYALIIGIEKFDNGTLPGEFLDDDAVAMYHTLLNSSNWKEENIKVLLNENATKANIEDAIVHWLGDQVTKDDVVLYYFCGHSWRVTIKKKIQGINGSTMTYPYDKSKNIITDLELGSWFDHVQSDHIVMILDTCYSGRMYGLVKDGRTILAAGGKYLLCPVDESTYLKSGIFTYFILQGLHGIADINDDGWVTAEEAFHYARWPTFYYSFWYQFPFNKELPLIVGPQLPYMYDNIAGSVRLTNVSG